MIETKKRKKEKRKKGYQEMKMINSDLIFCFFEKVKGARSPLLARAGCQAAVSEVLFSPR